MSMTGEFGILNSAYNASLDERLGFLRRAYLHMTGAVVAFVALSALLYQIGFGRMLIEAMGTSKLMWLLILGGFMIVSWMATAITNNTSAPASLQYVGLGAYTVGNAIIFAPLLFMAAVTDPDALPIATWITLLIFGGLTTYVMLTKKDFSFLAPILAVSGLAALGLIICAAIFGLSLGLWFSAIMVVFAVGCVLYSTSNVLHKYTVDQHVAAGLDLFASITILFWYVLRLVMGMRR